MSDITPEELEELKRQFESGASLDHHIPALIRSAEELADAKLGIAQFIAQNEGLQSAIGPLAEELAKWREIERLIGEAAGHSEYASWPVIVTVQNLREELARMRPIVETARKLCAEGRWITGLPDSDPQKGNGNRLADLFADYDRTAK